MATAQAAQLTLAPTSLRRLGSAAQTKVSQRPSLRRANRANLVVRAAKLPAGVEEPKVQPDLPTPFWGFTENAEVWNSRAAMIGFIGLLLLEFVTDNGILDLLGVEVGKGLDLPI